MAAYAVARAELGWLDAERHYGMMSIDPGELSRLAYRELQETAAPLVSAKGPILAIAVLGSIALLSRSSRSKAGIDESRSRLPVAFGVFCAGAFAFLLCRDHVPLAEPNERAPAMVTAIVPADRGASGDASRRQAVGRHRGRAAQGARPISLGAAHVRAKFVVPR